MKSLFFGFPIYGHTNPTLPVVRELVERGEQVIYYSSPTFRDPITDAGAEFRCYPGDFLRDPMRDADDLSRLPSQMMKATHLVLQKELARVRADGPDYVLHDAMAPWGACVSQLLDVPAASSITTFALNKKVASSARGFYRPRLTLTRLLTKARSIVGAVRTRKQIRRQFGIRGPHLMELFFCSEALNIVYTSRELQPHAETFDESYRFVGPSLGARPEAPDFDWEGLRGEPFIYVSMGTTFNRDPQLQQAILDALGDLPYRVLVSLGGRLTRRDLGKVPGNTVVRSQVPQLEVLPQSMLFISRGGMNSVTEALYHQKPMLIIPGVWEQSVVGRRVSELGAALVLPQSRATSSKIRETVNQLIFDPDYAAAARRLSDSLKATGGASQAAREILTYAGDAARPG